MSKQSTERRSYSVDEMMEKLREGERTKREREESELVTRPDGTQVVRVRRRKRRTKQSHKKREVRRKRLGIGLVALAVVAVVAVAATVLILLARYNSKGYRDELKERLLSATGAQIGIEELSVTPIKARAESVQLQWSGSGVLKTLKLRGLSAPLDPSSLLGADWNGELVNIESGSLHLGPPADVQGSPILDGSFPFEYEHYRCGNFEIIYGEDVDAPAFRLKNSEVTMRPGKEDDAQFLVNGGRLSLAGWNDLRVANGLAEVGEERFQLVSLRLSPPDDLPGEAVLRGTDAMRAGKPAKLSLELDGYSFAHLLGNGKDGLGNIFGGLIETSESRPGIVTVDPGAPGSSTLEVEFTGEEGSLKNLLFLRVLGGLFRNSDYNQPTEGVISGIVKHDRAGVHLRDFSFEAKAVLKLQGNVDLNRDGSLNGALRVGVPQGIFLTASLQRYHEIFSDQPEDGYLWIKISLFGSIDRPRDDFGHIVEKTVEPSGVQPGPESLWEETFRRLTEDPEEESEAPPEE